MIYLYSWTPSHLWSIPKYNTIQHYNLFVSCFLRCILCSSPVTYIVTPFVLYTDCLYSRYCTNGHIYDVFMYIPSHIISFHIWMRWILLWIPFCHCVSLWDVGLFFSPSSLSLIFFLVSESRSLFFIFCALCSECGAMLFQRHTETNSKMVIMNKVNGPPAPSESASRIKGEN